MGISLHRGPAGEPGRELVYRDFKRFTGDLGGCLKEGTGDGHLSP